MTADRMLAAHATAAAVDEAIRSRRADEQWYRRTDWAAWADLRRENLAILRALSKLRAGARRTARNEMPPDPIDEAKARADREAAPPWWVDVLRVAPESEAELREAFGG